MHYARKYDHDYTRGFYMVTISTFPRRDCLSRIVMAQIELTVLGEMVEEAVKRMSLDSPELEVRQIAIMPDHLHLVLVFRMPSYHPLGWHLRRMKARVTRYARARMRNPRFCIFAPDYHDAIAFDAQKLDNYVRYVRDNPLRWQWKQNHPEFFCRHFAVQHGRLPAGIPWTAIGDHGLLDSPEIEAVIVHRHIPEVERQRTIERYVTRAKEGVTLIGGFISPGEKEVARRVVGVTEAKIICLMPHGLRDYKPHGLAVRRLAEGTTLVLSGFPDSVPARPISYGNCHLNNAWATAIALQGQGLRESLPSGAMNRPARYTFCGTSRLNHRIFW